MLIKVLHPPIDVSGFWARFYAPCWNTPECRQLCSIEESFGEGDLKKDLWKESFIWCVSALGPCVDGLCEGQEPEDQ